MKTINDIYAAFGMVSTRLATIDYLVGSMITSLADPGNPFVGIVVGTEQKTFFQRLQILDKLFHIRYWQVPARITDFEAILKEIDSLRSKRNEIVHGMWSLQPKELEENRFRCELGWLWDKGKVGFSGSRKQTYWSLEDLQGLAEQLQCLMIRLLDLNNVVFSESR